jgi:hypothetical protein
MIKFRLTVVLFFLLSCSLQANAAKVHVNYHSESSFKVLIPTVSEVANQGSNTTYKISIENNQVAYYHVRLTKVGSINSSALPDEVVIGPNQKIDLPLTNFRGGDSLSLVADGSFNHWQVPTLLACDALYRALKGSAPPQSVRDGFMELAETAFFATQGEELKFANDLKSFAVNLQQLDVFGATKDLYDIGKNPLTQQLGFPRLPNWISFLAGAGAVIHLEIMTLYAPHVDVLTFDATYIGPGTTPPPVQPPTPVFTNNAKFIADISIPDDTAINPNQTFTKTWRIQNTGTSTWGSGYKWVFISGSQMNGPSYVNVPTVARNATCDISVNLRAPSGSNTYAGWWQMQSPSGQFFGQACYVRIRVYNGSTPVVNVYDNATWVKDLTQLDPPKGDVLTTNQPFVKTWQIRNTGNHAWGAGYKWVFVGENQMSGPDFINVPTVNPGSTWNPSLNLKAPSSPGRYKGYWQMQSPSTAKFGDRCYVDIVVDGTGSNVTTYVSESDRASAAGAPGFFRYGSPNYWRTATGYGDQKVMQWVYNNSTAQGIDNIGEWRPKLPKTQLYEVFVYIPSNYATTRQAHYEIYHADGRTDKTVDQYIYSDKWVSLGTYRFTAGSDNYVRLIDRTSEAYLSKMIGFDAMKWEERDAPPPPPTVTTVVPETALAPSQGAPGFWKWGPANYWHEVYGLGDGGRMLYTQNNSEAQGIQNMGDWRPNLPATGYYQVYVFVPHDHATSRNARYEIYHADGVAAVPVYQLAYNDEWVSIGTYRFNSGSGNYVRLIDMTNESAQTTQIGFDTVKWEKRDDPPPTLSTTVVRETDAAPYNGAAGFWKWGPSNYWHDVNGIGLDGHMLYTQNNDTAHGIENMGDWRPNLPQRAKYEVFVYIPHNYATTRGARYELYAADGRHDYTINQLSRNDEWVSLGTHLFNAGTGGYLRLIDMTSEGYITTTIGFDTAKWQRRPGTPSAPTNLQPRDSVITNAKVNFTWHDNAMDDGNASVNFQIQIWKIVDGQRAERVLDSDWFAGASRSWTAPEPGEYEWIVQAGNGVNQSAVSQPTRFVVPLPAPDAPTHLSAYSDSPDHIALSWEDNSKEESGFKIERKTGTGQFAEIGTVAADETAFSDSDLQAGTTYTYRIRAYNATGNSAYSNEAEAVTTLTRSLIDISLSSEYVEGGISTTATVTLDGPALSEGAAITLDKGDAGSLASMPETLNIPAGENSATFVIQTHTVTAVSNLVVTANYAGASQSASLSIIPVNHAPVANAQSVVTNEDAAKVITLTATDPDKAPLTYSVVKAPLHGKLTGTAPHLTYTPILNYNGPDSFTFKAGNGKANSNIATVSIIVNPINDAPVANAQSVTANEDIARAIILTATDVDKDPLTYDVVTPPKYGKLTGTAPTVTYTPNKDFNGKDSFTFRAVDGKVSSNFATVSITVNPLNDAPVANAQSVTANEDTARLIILTATDVDKNPLTYNVVTPPKYGKLTGTAPTVTYTPNKDFNGKDSFTFRASDGKVSSNIATVSIAVNALNDAPLANAQSVTANEDTPKAITLTATDVDKNPLTYKVWAAPKYGKLTGVAPKLTYTPNKDFNGKDSFTFRVSDGKASSNVATVSITVNPINDAPVAIAQSVTTNEDVAKAITLTATDAEKDPLTYKVWAAPKYGKLTGVAPNLTYTPNKDFNGKDSFTFRVSESKASSNVATVSITVNAVANAPIADAPLVTGMVINTAPVATGTSVSTSENAPLAIVLAGLVTDDTSTGDDLTYTLVTAPPASQGTVSLEDGVVVFTPAANFYGQTSFTYKAQDKEGLASETQTVTISVGSVENAPVLDPIGSKTVQALSELSFQVTASDGDDNLLTFSLQGAPSGASITADGVFSWTPSLAQAASRYTFQVRVFDGTSYQQEEITVTVQ